MKTLMLIGILFVQMLQSSGAETKGITAGYGYDGRNRLTNVWYSNGFRETYRYDAAGNRIERHTFGPPTIDPINDRAVVGGKKTLIPFVVRHSLIPITNIVVTAHTLDASVISSDSLSIVGLGTNRVLEITAAPHMFGRSANIKLIASDGYVSFGRVFAISLVKEDPKSK
jgi:YD repeat-containing protein